jgi:hypothetical protein
MIRGGSKKKVAQRAKSKQDLLPSMSASLLLLKVFKIVI